MPTYGAGGFAPSKFWVRQRVDQGQDFEIKLGAHLRAPGDGRVLEWAHDGPFPSGFGSNYMVCEFTSGRFAGLTLYIGHVEHDLLPPGTSFKEGAKLGRVSSSLNAGLGWVEIGLWPPGPMGNGEKIAHLFTDVEVFTPLHLGSRGKRVVAITRRLAYLRIPGSKDRYLSRWHWRYGKKVKAAVRLFQKFHRLPETGIVDRETGAEIQASFKHQREHRRKNA
jgi:Putative peptidoglycan binding domain